MTAERRPDDDLNAIDFIAHQLYMQSLNGSMGVLWLCMREDLQARWRRDAQNLFNGWRQHELERQHSRQELDDEIAQLAGPRSPR